LTLIIEYYLGKTEKIKAGSIAELMWILIVSGFIILIGFIKKGDGNGKSGNWKS